MVRAITYFSLPTCSQCRGPLKILKETFSGGCLTILNPAIDEESAALFDFNLFRSVPAILITLSDGSMEKAQGTKQVTELIGQLAELK